MNFVLLIGVTLKG